MISFPLKVYIRPQNVDLITELWVCNVDILNNKGTRIDVRVSK